MTTLIVQAHPLGDSYSSALLGAVNEQHPSARVVRLGQGDTLEADHFEAVTNLIAIYPTWWGSLPAIFLAALESTIGPWIDGDQPVDTSPLRSVMSLTVITSHGSSKLINMLQGEPGLQLWKRTVLPLCAPGASFTWRSLYKLDRATDVERTSFLRDVAPSA